MDSNLEVIVHDEMSKGEFATLHLAGFLLNESLFSLVSMLTGVRVVDEVMQALDPRRDTGKLCCYFD